jgi:hypothetical protein
VQRATPINTIAAALLLLLLFKHNTESFVTCQTAQQLLDKGQQHLLSRFVPFIHQRF